MSQIESEEDRYCPNVSLQFLGMPVRHHRARAQFLRKELGDDS